MSGADARTCDTDRRGRRPEAWQQELERRSAFVSFATLPKIFHATLMAIWEALHMPIGVLAVAPIARSVLMKNP